MHPYTLAATPTKPAYRYDDVLIGDIAKINRVVRAAERLHTSSRGSAIRSGSRSGAGSPTPPNRTVGDSYPTATPYTAYSMYEMWRASLIIWFTVRDLPGRIVDSPGFVNGGALYTSTGRPKLTLRAFSFSFSFSFSFPVVASVAHGRGFV